MKKLTSYSKRVKYTYVKTTLATLFVSLFFLKGYAAFEKTGENYFHVFLNGNEIGTVGEADRAEQLLQEARRNIASQSDDMIFVDADLKLVGEEVLWGTLDNEDNLLAAMERELESSIRETSHRSYTMKVNEYMVNLSSVEDVESLLQAAVDKYDSEDNLLAAMERELESSIRETSHRSYTMKVNEYMVNLSSVEDVESLLQAAVDKYDSEDKFSVELTHDAQKEFNVLTTEVVNKQELTAQEEQKEESIYAGGVQSVLDQAGSQADQQGEKDFEDYDLGLMTMDFAEKVEIVETYLPESMLTPLDQAIEDVIKDQETPGEYEVVSGDTLSEISIKVNIPMDQIIAMNSETLTDENSTIRVGDKLIITVPQPELSVERMEQNYYEEIYDADVIYVDNDSWYTTQTKILQQPSAGFRRVVADVSYLNDREVTRDILKEEVVMEAVPKIVERGTKIPPTYIKPISGGRLSSNFGRRKSPTKGASSYHKGVDWSVPTGTAVFASCGGTVARAGWGSGYGYCVYINHEDGRQTRYGHLSKVLVKVGQTVKQGERIALSGNTGVSTGPHLHFEILINGSQVNPLKYLN
jgi:murein DD-endopeptidase MepM/ murein hydrolase activator NlpD